MGVSFRASGEELDKECPEDRLHIAGIGLVGKGGERLQATREGAHGARAANQA